MISAGLGGFVNQFLEVPNRQRMNKKENRHWGNSLRKFPWDEYGGYNREDLQDWMNLVWLILSPPENRYEKVKGFRELAISAPLRVKFRDVMSKKQSK